VWNCFSETIKTILIIRQSKIIIVSIIRFPTIQLLNLVKFTLNRKMRSLTFITLYGHINNIIIIIIIIIIVWFLETITVVVITIIILSKIIFIVKLLNFW